MTTTQSNDTPIFRLYRVNHRRAMRGAEAVQMEITYLDGTQNLLWMSKKDIRENIKAFGPSEGLTKGLQAYGVKK